MRKDIIQKTFGSYRAPSVPFPDLVGHQRESFLWLLKDGLAELFKEFSPITDYSGKKFELQFESFEIGEPKYDEEFARENMRTYEAPVKVTVKLVNKTLGSEKSQEIFLADIPLMTPHGSFIIYGVERIIVPQLARSFGVFFAAELIRGKQFFGAKIIPRRGVWIEIESDPDGAIYVKIDRKRKFPVTNLLPSSARTTRGDLKHFAKNAAAIAAIEATLAHDHGQDRRRSLYRDPPPLRDGDIATPENAQELSWTPSFRADRYDLSEGRPLPLQPALRLADRREGARDARLTLDDVVHIVSRITDLNADPDASADDIDHLGFRRVRFVGELLAAAHARRHVPHEAQYPGSHVDDR